MKKVISPATFFKRHLPEGVTITAAARRIGSSHQAVRQWLKRGVIPEDRFKNVAGILGVSVEQLREAGFREGAKSRKRPVMSDVLPLLKNIVESQLEVLTLEELDYLILQQNKFDHPMSAALVRELVLAEFPYREPKSS